MQYMGGKARIARHIVKAILDDGVPRDRWFEPFVGGGKVMEHAAPFFRVNVGADIHPDLILMWRAVVDGWIPPDNITRELYAELRHAEPSALRGFVGFGASFGGKWFAGYGSHVIDARHPYGDIWRSSRPVVIRQGEVFRRRRVQFLCKPFGRVTPPPGTVVYCDPPYVGTTGYQAAPLDYGMFYRTLRQWAQTGCHVYLSGYSIPAAIPHRITWEKATQVSLKADTNLRSSVERLYRIEGTQ